MAFKRLIAYPATSTADFMSNLVSVAVAAGWTLHDDRSSETPPYYVLKSNGENPETVVPCYFYIQWHSTTDRIQIMQYIYWNNSTHTGVVSIGSTTNSYITSDDDGAFYGWVWANLNGIAIATKVASTYYAGMCFRLAPFYVAFGRLTSGISAGSGVTLHLQKGQSRGFVIGTNVMMIDISPSSLGYQSSLTISAVDTDNDTITISSSISYNFPQGTIVGYSPYPWAHRRDGLSYTGVYHLSTGTSSSSYASLSGFTYSINYSYIDPEEAINAYLLNIVLITRPSSTGVGGFIHKNRLLSTYSTSSYEDTVSVGVLQDTETASSGTSNTLVHSGKSWGTNDYANKAVILVGGTGSGQIRTITSNTSDTLTVDTVWSTLPDASTQYIICEEAYRHFGFGAASYAACFFEGGDYGAFPTVELTTTSSTTTTTTTV